MLLAAIAIGGGSRALDADAQTAPPTGTISGSVRMVTPNRTFEGATAQLIILREGAAAGDLEAIEQEVPASGEFVFEAEADATIDYVIVLRYAEQPYFSQALRISPELPTASVEFEVFATTAEPPALTIDATLVTLLAIDRQASELTLVREDQIRLDEPIIFIGGDDGVTLRIPVPDGTREAGGFDEATGEYQFDGGTVTVAEPLRPGVTSILTRYTVRYESDEDEYRLRVTAPFDTAHIEIRVPERFLDAVIPRGDEAEFGPDGEFEGETLTVVQRSAPAGAGQGLIADLQGLSGVELAKNPLASGSGAAIGALIALVTVAGLSIGLSRGLHRPTK